MPSTLGTLLEMLDKFSDQTPQLDENHCLNFLHNRAGRCTACVEACPVEAIQVGPVPVIDGGACLACDACTAVCPTAALQGQRAPLAVWRDALKQEEGGAVFVCRAVGGGQFEAARIPCASALTPELLIGLGLEGRTQVTVFTAECAACPVQATLEQAHRAIADARAFLALLGIDLAVRLEEGRPPVAEVQPRPAAAVSRRGFLSALWNPPVSRSRPDDSLDELAETGIGWRRALLLNALLRHVPADTEVTLPSQPGLWGAYEVDEERCMGCQMCTQFCPTGALASTVDEESGDVALWFSAARCTACGLCERVCFKDALKLTPTVPLAALMAGDFVPLWRGAPPYNPLKAHMKHTVTP
ncbi:MAG: 4Fe-4S binding protein [Anaerolineae bacterium]|nr:4Fe-4S binding protein [Anaerolineae bacterium]